MRTLDTLTWFQINHKSPSPNERNVHILQLFALREIRILEVKRCAGRCPRRPCPRARALLQGPRISKYPKQQGCLHVQLMQVNRRS